MACFHPLKAIKSSSGVQVLNGSAILYNLRLPCGQCVGCRLERSRQWALRCIHEASLHDSNSFITLTYSDEHCPSDGGLHYRDIQLFLKRLRKAFPAVRYYGAGEYGGKLGRPHWHIILFGIDFDDKVYLQKSPTGSRLYRSPSLERLWNYGFSSIGAVTFESAAYVARYIMKKVTGDPSHSAYRTVDIGSGEVQDRRPEFNFMSLKPGIGHGWYDKFESDVFPHDRVVHNGSINRVPRYYDQLLGRSNPLLLERIKSKRVLDAMKHCADNTDARLLVKETVKKAAISNLKRSL